MGVFYIAVLGAISNRIRGYGIKIYFINQDWINAFIFGFAFMDKAWHLPVLMLSMIAGAATGWTSFIKGVRGDYEMSEKENRNWISKIVKPTNQWTTFLYGCIRATVWVVPIYLAFLICGTNKPLLFLTIPLFYTSYRTGYLLNKKGDSTEVGELIWGAIFWTACYLT
ncbi:MAG: hypothetical protein EOL95_09310 [Bacteroidia bacterium]|nr:hypothetical protein [Bacteroidia bacterium]